MGLFDKLKGAVQNAAENLKEGYDEAMSLDIYGVCDELKNLGTFDSKGAGYRAALRDKCETLGDTDLEEFYKYIKDAGSIFKPHPGRSIVEDVLVDRKMYIRDKDGNITKNSLYKFNR